MLQTVPLRFSAPDGTSPSPIPASHPTIQRQYATQTGAIRGSLRSRMNAALGMYPYILYSTRDVTLTCRCTADASGDRDAKMHWTVTDFRDFIFMPHRLKLVGWPPEYIFRNPSKMRTHEMRTLLCLLNTNRLYFTRASDEEVADARLNARAAAPGPLFPAPPLNYGRRDIGRRLPRYDEHGQLKKTR